MSKALASALNSLTRREHSVLELKKKLEQKGYSASEATLAVEECQRLGYQSDGRFTEALCRSRIMQGYGPLRIKQELSAKGINAEMIEQVLEYEPEDSWCQRAFEVASKKCAELASLIASVFEKF